eukprot:CAMPEP_0175894858 /NCGR_PEP_ID=MMETSP0107_2-20121207/50216_1 /TAXON_ID=195067 ORGANISM="Goniomonas pacifica, Strain CCMP1869" /NCGR_SAMPLE_ID=MMETSP0107_2 /ASSEMBLY_ACC=CAM_ASM_000203 /LENGTH=40 /DNA_ID= /DNA_START= /DNA_END= /DNA_ORIENTATION=
MSTTRRATGLSAMADGRSCARWAATTTAPPATGRTTSRKA